MSQVHKKGNAKASMNMTPLIDVTFQLILFFMLVSNIIAEESIKLKVPQLDEPQTRELGDVNRIIISVASGETYSGQDRDANPLTFDPRARIISLGVALRWDLAQVGLAQAMDELSGVLKKAKQEDKDVQVLLRADAALHYSEVEPIMAVITGANITTVNMVAELPKAGGPQPSSNP